MIEFTNSQDHITSFKRFFEIIDQRHIAYVDRPEKWIFRGHDCCDYRLIPSIGRLLGTPRFQNKEDVILAERNAFNQFEVSTYEDLKEANKFIILAVAQHHGLKTRLLDWTLSPLVALFFAVEDESKYHHDGAFFAFNRARFTTILRKVDSPFDDLKAKYQYLAIPSLTPRISAQSGIFQLFNNPTEPFENPTEPFEKGERLEKFIIPKEDKKAIKIDLSNLGITYNVLFPDFDGIAKNLNYSILNEYPF